MLPDTSASLLHGGARAMVQEEAFDGEIHSSREPPLPPWEHASDRYQDLGSRPELSGCVCSGCRQLGYTSTAGMSLSEGDAQICFQVVCTRLCLDVFGFLVLSQNTCKFLFLLRAGRN